MKPPIVSPGLRGLVRETCARIRVAAEICERADLLNLAGGLRELESRWNEHVKRLPKRGRPPKKRRSS